MSNRAIFNLKTLLLTMWWSVVCLYTFALLANFSTLSLFLNGDLSYLVILQILGTLPMYVFLNTSPLLFFLFLFNTLLAGFYVTLFLKLIMEEKKVRISYGLSASLVNILSVGCAACGSLLTPLVLIGGAGIPAALLGTFTIAIALGATLLLLLGILSLYKRLAYFSLN